MITHYSPALRYLAAALAALALLAAVTAGASAEPAYPPRADAAVNDFAGVLAEADRAALQQVRAELFGTRGVELVIVTIGSVSDYDVPDSAIEAFATGLFNSWGIGDRARNDGVLLLVAVRDRAVRIELGSGYGSSYNAAMQEVIDRDMLPAFRAGSYGAGVVAGARGIQAALSAAPASQPTLLRIAGLRTPLGLGVSLLAVLGLAGGGYGIARAVRARGRRERCPGCRAGMRALRPEAAVSYLTEGQQVETQVGAASYTVWGCRRCGQHKAVRKQLVSGLVRCPSCRYQTLYSTAETLPTLTRHGQRQKRIERRCHNCHFRDHRTETLPKATRTGAADTGSGAAYDSGSSATYDYSSGGTSDTSSSSSFDSGGSSSGDGASGSW